jgi:glycyl-tRNA synthetase beta chain
LDVLSGCFSVGIIPKGGADPQGLRRAAGGLCAILRDAGVSMSLEELFAPALTTHADNAKRDLNEVQAELVEFTLARLKAQLQGEGLSAGCVDAAFGAVVGSNLETDVVDIAARSHALGRLAALPEFADLRVAFKRVMGLTKDHFEESCGSELFESPAEHALHAALEGVRSEAKAAAESQDYDRALALMSQLKLPVDAFFEAVLVMCEDEAVRLNRLGLLRSIANLFRMVADFTRFTGEGDRR